jgi:glycolate oxidase FAD binding subunit
MSEARAIEALNRWGGQPLPISASAWSAGELRVRLSGAAPAVRAAEQKIGGSALGETADAYWHAVREQSLPFFAGEDPLWRLAVPPATPPLDLPGGQLIEWGGALRWLKSSAPAAKMREAVARAGGHATLFRAREKSAACFTPLGPIAMRMHRELKAAFDPAGIFNPGRLYPEL